MGRVGTSIEAANRHRGQLANSRSAISGAGIPRAPGNSNNTRALVHSRNNSRELAALSSDYAEMLGRSASQIVELANRRERDLNNIHFSSIYG